MAPPARFAVTTTAIRDPARRLSSSSLTSLRKAKTSFITFSHTRHGLIFLLGIFGFSVFFPTWLLVTIAYNSKYLCAPANEINAPKVLYFGTPCLFIQYFWLGIWMAEARHRRTWCIRRRGPRPGLSTTCWVGAAVSVGVMAFVVMHWAFDICRTIALS